MQSLNLRLIHTHDTEANWNSHEEFVPKAGEVIVYDLDDMFSYERFKIGDGITKLKDLPFTVENIIETIFNIENNVIYADAGRITNYKDNPNT